MQPDDVVDLLLYGRSLWPRKFIIPQNEDELALANQAWMDVLGDFEVELIRAALVSWSGEWPPDLGQLRERALEISGQADGIEVPGADEAWSEFRANYRFGADWSHPAIEAAANAIGCREYGQSRADDEMAWRAHFMKLYAVALDRWKHKTRPAAPVLASYVQRSVIEAGARKELTS